MSEITKIVIKGSSGDCCKEESYRDKIVITEESIAYEYRPMVETKINPTRKWSYKTTSPVFKNLYGDLIGILPDIIDRDIDDFFPNLGNLQFNLTYSDNTKYRRGYYTPADEFKYCFLMIKRMVPDCEYIPALLLSEDDYKE